MSVFRNSVTGVQVSVADSKDDRFADGTWESVNADDQGSEKPEQESADKPAPAAEPKASNAKSESASAKPAAESKKEGGK